MKEVLQRRRSQVDGDCFQACLASILELPLEDVPADHSATTDESLPVYKVWLASRGYYMLLADLKPSLIPLGYSIGHIEGDDWTHAVVCCDGEVVWDPDITSPPLNHPDRIEPTLYYLFVALDPTNTPATLKETA